MPTKRSDERIVCAQVRVRAGARAAGAGACDQAEDPRRGRQLGRVLAGSKTGARPWRGGRAPPPASAPQQHKDLLPRNRVSAGGGHLFTQAQQLKWLLRC